LANIFFGELILFLEALIPIPWLIFPPILEGEGKGLFLTKGINLI